MTNVAQGIVKKTSIIKQASLGTPGAGAGSQTLRRITSVFSAERDTFESNEIIAHEQSTGVAYGLKKTTGKISGLLSPATYKLLFASALRKDFAAGVALAIESDITATAAGPQYTSAATATFLTDGYKVGDIVRWTGWTGGNAPNNGKNFLITGLTELTMTGVHLDGSAVIADASGESVTATVVGKKTRAPLTAHTNDYFTVEEWFSDISKSELFTDLKVNQIDVGLPATGNATFSADLLGLGRSITGAQVLTTPTAETTTPIMTASNGVVYVNGSAVGTITGASLSIMGNMSAGEAIVGSNSAIDIARGRIKVTGSFTALFTDTVISALYDAETPISLVLVLCDNPSTAASSFITFTMGRIKVTGDAPDDGEKTIVRTYPFTAEINSAGGTAATWDQTILSIQDSDA